MPGCVAQTAKGRPCRNRAMPGSDLCSIHIGRTRRPTALTDAIRDELASLLRAGNYAGTALAAVNVPKATFYEWLDRGAGDESPEPYRAFRQTIDRARSEGEARNVLIIRTAATGMGTPGEPGYRPPDWKAAAWILERQHPDRWGRVRPNEPDADEPVTVQADDPFAQLPGDPIHDELAQRRASRR